jgi:hypothetical protein
MNLMLVLKLQQGFDENFITKIIMKLFFNWIILFGIVVAFYVMNIFYYPKIIDMHVWF